MISCMWLYINANIWSGKMVVASLNVLQQAKKKNVEKDYMSFQKLPQRNIL